MAHLPADRIRNSGRPSKSAERAEAFIVEALSWLPAPGATNVEGQDESEGAHTFDGADPGVSRPRVLLLVARKRSSHLSAMKLALNLRTGLAAHPGLKFVRRVRGVSSSRRRAQPDLQGEEGDHGLDHIRLARFLACADRQLPNEDYRRRLARQMIFLIASREKHIGFLEPRMAYFDELRTLLSGIRRPMPMGVPCHVTRGGLRWLCFRIDLEADGRPASRPARLDATDARRKRERLLIPGSRRGGCNLHQPTGVFAAPIPWYVRPCIRKAIAWQLMQLIALANAEHRTPNAFCQFSRKTYCLDIFPYRSPLASHR